MDTLRRKPAARGVLVAAAFACALACFPRGASAQASAASPAAFAVLVTGVAPGSSAARAGFVPYDLILRIDGRAPASTSEFLSLISAKGARRFEIRRGDGTAALNADKTDAPYGFEFAALDPAADDYAASLLLVFLREPDPAARATAASVLRERCTRAWMRAAFDAAEDLGSGGDADTGVTILSRVAEIAAAYGDADYLGIARFYEARLHFHYRDDAAAAERAFTDALALFRKTGNRLGEANCVMSLGDLALARADFDGAKRRYDEALASYRALGDALGQANCAKGLGDLALYAGAYDEARARYEDALARYRAAEDVRGQANCLLSLGDLAFRTGRYAETADRLERALALYGSLDDGLGRANALKALGDLDFARSAHADARARYEEALALYRKLGSTSGAAACALGLGDVALQRSELDGAAARYAEARALYERSGDELGQASCRKAFADIALRRGDYDGARRGYEDALAVFERSRASSASADCLSNLGELLFRRGDYEGARWRYEAALERYAKLSNVNGRANCLSSLATLDVAAGRFADAEARYLEALALYRGVDGFLGMANCLADLGSLARRRGDPDGARERYDEALPLFKRVGDILGEANCVKDLGLLARDRGDYAEADGRLARAIALYESIDSAHSLLYAWTERCRNDLARGDKKAAVDSLGRAVDRALDVRSKAGGSGERLQFAEARGTSLKEIMLAVAPVDPRAALDQWERYRGRGFLEGLSGKAALDAAGVPERDRAAWLAGTDALARARDELARAAQAGGPDAAARLPVLREAVTAAERALDAAAADLAARHPRYGELRLPVIPPAARAASALRPGETALVYLTDGARTGVFTVRRDGSVSFAALADAPGGVAALVVAYRTALVAKSRGEPFKEKPDAIWNRLAPYLTPPESSVPAGTERLVIVPDGALALVPWEYLPWNGGLYGQAFRVSYAPSLAVLHRLRSPERDYSSRARVPILSFGGAYYESTAAAESPAAAATATGEAGAAETEASSGTNGDGRDLVRGFRERGWENLPGAEREAKDVARPYYRSDADAAATVFSGILASEAAVKRLNAGALAIPGSKPLRLADARVLHFACHGQAVADFPETSRIVLTQAEAVPAAERAAFAKLVEGTGASDGTLLAAEIVGLDLKADLVVLSACETAEGKVTATEGVVGLVQSWMTAGANGVVASLWPVDDEGTRLFMTLFHARLAEGADPAEAIHATRELLRTGAWKSEPWRRLVPWARGDYSSPFYWAAFQYWGK